MKLSELHEALTANWTVDRIKKLPKAKYNILLKNANNANDEKVLAMFKQIEDERYQAQVDAKAKAEKARKDRANERAIKQKDGFKIGDHFFSKEDLGKIAQKFEEIVGNTFPDGDPIDQMAPWLVKTYRVPAHFTGEIFDKAVSANLGFKTYTDYLANAWDQYKEDEMFPDGYHQDKNPWK